MGQSQTLTGLRAKLYINNRLLGIATGVEFVINTGRKPIYGIDQIAPAELAPGQYSITGKIDCVRVSNGGLEARGVAASQSNLLLEKYINIKIMDRVGNTTIFSCESATVDSQQWRVESRGLMRGSFSFSGLSWSNESEI